MIIFLSASWVMRSSTRARRGGGGFGRARPFRIAFRARSCASCEAFGNQPIRVEVALGVAVGVHTGCLREDVPAGAAQPFDALRPIAEAEHLYPLEQAMARGPVDDLLDGLVLALGDAGRGDLLQRTRSLLSTSGLTRCVASAIGSASCGSASREPSASAPSGAERGVLRLEGHRATPRQARAGSPVLLPQ